MGTQLVGLVLALALQDAAPSPPPVQLPDGMPAPSGASGAFASEPAQPGGSDAPTLPQDGDPPADGLPGPQSSPVVEPAVVEPVVSAAAEAPENEPRFAGRIEGVLTDTEIEGVAIAGARVELVCTCLQGGRLTISDVDGRYQFEDLPQGIYTVFATRGGRPTKSTVALIGMTSQRLNLQVGPPTTTDKLEGRAMRERRALTLISVGGVAGIGAFGMLVAAAVERRKPECDFGLDECADAPRPAVTTGLTIGGALLAAGAAAAIGLGAHRLRRVRAEIAADQRSASLVLVGRF